MSDKFTKLWHLIFGVKHSQVWDVLSNKEAVDVIASAPTRATAARALVECAVRAWRLKYPTSKIDDCAVVCLFFDPPSPESTAQAGNSDETPPEQHVEAVPMDMEIDIEVGEGPDSYLSSLEQSNVHDDEIVPASEEPVVEKLPGRSNSTRSLADCISHTDEEEWSALEGVTRVNSLLSLPRFLSKDKKSRSQRK